MCLFVVILVFVGLMAGLIKETPPEIVYPDPTTTTQATTSTQGTTTPPPSTDPWMDPFLPSFSFPIHYDLWLYPDFYWQGNSFDGRIDIEIQIRANTKYLIVHQKAMSISNSQVKIKDGAALSVVREFAYEPHEFWVVEVDREIAAGTSVILHLDFTGSLVNGIVGFYKSNYTNTITGEERWLATSKFQPTDARKAFPNFDEPKYKATFQVTLRHWSNFTALNNMPNLTTVPVEGMNEVFSETVFEVTPVMSSYLICFIVTDFVYKENHFATSGIPHRIWTSVDKIDQVDYALKLGKEVGDYFETEMDMKFHLPKLDQVAVPDYPSGATEHWGLITYRETNLLYDEASVAPSGKERVALIVGHELAHNYFGNLVTCDWWDGIWLNEAFANYYQFKSVVGSEPTWDLNNYFVVDTLHAVMELDATSSSRPILMEVTHPDDINQAFDGIIYDKGASMLRMIENFMGSETWRAAIRKYLVEHEYATVVSQDLWDALQEELGGQLDISLVMSRWTEQMGYPVITITVDGGNFIATPSRFLSNPTEDPSLPESPHDYKWYIPFGYQFQGGNIERIWMNDTSVTIEDTRNNPATDWIKFNPNNFGYFRVNYPTDMWQQFASLLAGSVDTFPPVDRANLMDDVLNLARASQLDYQTAMEMTTYLAEETHYFPWVASRSALEYISSMLYGNKEYNLFRRYVREITERVMNELQVDAGGDHQEQSLRTGIIRLSCGHGYSGCLQNISNYFYDWVDNDASIPPSIRQEVYLYGMAQYGAEREFDILWERYESVVAPQEKLYILNAMAQARDVFLIQRYLEYCRDETRVRPGDFFSAVQYAANNPVGTAYVWNWVRANYEEFVGRFGLADRYFGRMIPNIISSFKTDFQLQEVEAFFEKYPDAGTGSMPRAQALDSIRNNIYWRENNEQLVIDWLKDYYP